MEVVSAEANKEMLETVPHQNIEDMAVVYRFVLSSDDDGRASILVTNQLLENMGVTPEQLHADAMENAPQIKPVEIKGMSEVLAEMMGVEQAEMMGIVPVAPEDEQMRRGACFKYIFGDIYFVRIKVRIKKEML